VHEATSIVAATTASACEGLSRAELNLHLAIRAGTDGVDCVCAFEFTSISAGIFSLWFCFKGPCIDFLSKVTAMLRRKEPNFRKCFRITKIENYHHGFSPNFPLERRF
jgi:hypothetical protein